jgi:Protein of unknown function (DUF2846)
MMRRWFLRLCLPLALLGCGAGSQQKLALPAVSASKARLVFYRGGDPYNDGLVWTRVLLNGASIGDAAPGTVFYRDVTPGVYQIGVDSEKLYPDQVKAVALDAGSTTYVKVMSAPFWGQSGVQWWGNTFTTAVIAPAVGQAEIGPLRLTSG